MLGGLGWVLKGGTIMLAGPQWLEWGLGGGLLFPLGLLGLHALLNGRGGRLGRIGGWLAYIAAALLLVSVAGAILTAVFTGEFTSPALPFMLTIVTSFLCMFASLVLLGIATLRAKVLPPRWRALPLAGSILAVPLMVLGGVLESLSERYAEIPIVVVGLAWMVLGYLIWYSASVKATQPSHGS